MTTPDELGNYLRKIAWSRYRIRDCGVLDRLPVGADGRLTLAQVRCAIAAASQALRWRFLQEGHHYDDRVLS